VRSGRQSRIRSGGSILEDLFRAARDMVAGTLIDSAREAARDFLHRSLTALLLYVVAAVLLGTAAVFLLLGGFEALRLLKLPEAAAYAVMGAVALGAGLAALLSAGSRNDS
jgi:hypothetical protein